MDITDNKAADETTKGPAKKLGLSKVVYALGMSARDSLVTFVAATAAIAPVMYWGQGRSKMVDKVAKLPEQIHSGWNRLFDKRAGKIGTALAVSAGLASIIGYAAHLPGLIRGPKKISEAEDIYNAEVQDNKNLSKEVQDLTETVKRQGMELTAAKKASGSFAERVRTTETAGSNSLSL